MAGTTLTTAIRRRLYTVAGQIAKPFTDSRRRTFVKQMLVGLVSSGQVHLTAIARGVSGGAGNIHAMEKRLSGHLGSEHWDMSPVADELLRRSASRVTDETLLVADTTDLAKPYARALEGLGRVHDGSDPQQRIVPGYYLFESYVRVGRWQLFPLLIEPLKVYAGAPTGENAEILSHLLRIHAATGQKGTWLLDRGFDRRELFGPLVRNRVAFVVRECIEPCQQIRSFLLPIPGRSHLGDRVAIKPKYREKAGECVREVTCMTFCFGRTETATFDDDRRRSNRRTGAPSDAYGHSSRMAGASHGRFL
jgi:hypothetical protein